MTLIAAAILVTLTAYADPEAPKEPPSEAELAAITERGRDLAGYAAAAWHASDAVQAKNPKEGSVAGYIARKTDKGWVVAFGRLDEDKTKGSSGIPGGSVGTTSHGVESFSIGTFSRFHACSLR